jgi:hypothetical protein
MAHRFESVIPVAILVVVPSVLPAAGQDVPDRGTAKPASDRPQDPAAAATAVLAVPADRPEQQLTEHDRSDAFDFKKPSPLTPALKGQPKEGRITGFDFARDPLNADKPFTTFEEVMSKEAAQRPTVMAKQRPLLESRYNLVPKLDPQAKMSRGKPLRVGPTARLPEGMTFEQLASLGPEEIKAKGLFPYPSLPYPLHTNGGQVFPQVQTAMFPRLELNLVQELRLTQQEKADLVAFLGVL